MLPRITARAYLSVMPRSSKALSTMFSSSEQFVHVTTVCSGWSSVSGTTTSFNITGSNTIVSRISFSLDFAVAPGTRKERTARMLAIRLFIVIKKGSEDPRVVTDSGSCQSALERNDRVCVYTDSPTPSKALTPQEWNVWGSNPCPM